MTKLFGSSGIRGVYGKKITPELMLSVGKALGDYLEKDNKERGIEGAKGRRGEGAKGRRSLAFL